jgi:hypothetical protein
LSLARPYPEHALLLHRWKPTKSDEELTKMSRLRPSTLLLSLWCECDKDMGFIILLLLKLKNKWAYVQAIGSVVY